MLSLRRKSRPAAVDLSAEMAALADRLAEPSPDGGRAIQFVSARTGEGVSTVARAFARAAAARSGGRGVWLVELDVLAQAQFEAFADGAYGELGEPVRGSPDDSAFFQVVPPVTEAGVRPPPPGDWLEAWPVRGERFWITRFRSERLRPGQSVRLTGGADYWDALKAYADLIVVDAPAAERSRAAAATAPHMDATVLVVGADNDDPAGPALLRDGLEAVGGRCAGMVLNRARPRAPGFLRALAP